MTFAWGAELPTLTGQRARLRALTGADAPDVLAIFGDHEVMRFWSSPPLGGLQDAQTLIDDIHQFFDTRTLFQWGVCSSGADAVVGTCTLFNLEKSHRRAEVGFALRRSVWGQGLGRDAVSTLIDFAFRELDLHRLEADVDPKNVRSLRLVEGLGFRREGYLRERWHHLGQVHDAVMLGLLRSEWRRDSSRAAQP